MKNIFEGKSIILAITPDVKLSACFVDNLQFLGFEVFLLCNEEKFKYKTLKNRLYNFYLKYIFKDKTYKKQLVKAFYTKANLEKLSKFPNTDYSLVIRPDLFDISVISEIVAKSKEHYAYQWDGLDRFPDVMEAIPFFNNFYVFDKKDLSISPKTDAATNFYFDCYSSIFNDAVPEYDAYFIGSYDGRINTLISLCEFLKKHDFKLNILLRCSPKKHLKKYKYIKYIKKPLSYYENLKMVANSKMLIDIHHDALHSGLSFRSFEALGYDKKLITSNTIIADYDFYDGNNIFIIGNENSNFENFLSEEYKKIDPNVKSKYGFTNWIKYILKSNNYINIDIP